MWDIDLDLQEGIIPARAGFTLRRRRGHLGGEDHPRSRGVYGGHQGQGVAPEGSSPLARGLPPIPQTGQRIPGIIPARAGFTCAQYTAPMRSGDHPRSRGVYSTVRAARNAASGSSPLARGLRGAGDRAGSGGRIIPARAGFTLPRRQGRRRRADHPRSRGVYALFLASALVDEGSSPLARGLRRGDTGPRGRGRIIPARAGFTRGSFRGVRIHTDHPRSRGVYL